MSVSANNYKIILSDKYLLRFMLRDGVDGVFAFLGCAETYYCYINDKVKCVE